MPWFLLLRLLVAGTLAPGGPAVAMDPPPPDPIPVVRSAEKACADDVLATRALVTSRSFDNRSNVHFYDHLPHSHFVDRAKACGIETCVDLDNDSVRNTLKKQRARRGHPIRILEIGAGYGRVLGWLLDHTDAEITALEHSTTLMSHLRQRYGGSPRVTLVQQSLLDIDMREAVEVALWMWSGVAEFNLEEKRRGLHIVSVALIPGGNLLIDLPEPGASDPQTIFFEVAGLRLFLETVAEETLIQMAIDEKLEPVMTNCYTTTTGLRRHTHHFTKPQRRSPPASDIPAP